MTSRNSQARVRLDDSDSSSGRKRLKGLNARASTVKPDRWGVGSSAVVHCDRGGGQPVCPAAVFGGSDCGVVGVYQQIL